MRAFDMHPKSWTYIVEILEVYIMGKELYCKEIKLEAVQYVLSGHSYRQASEKFKISTTPIEKWVNAYKIHGEKGLESRNTARQKELDGQFRLNVIKYKNKHGLSCTQTASLFCLDVVTISRWDKKYHEKGEDAFMSDKNNQKISIKAKQKDNNSESVLENQILAAENRRLKMENEYLKKLNALIQERENS